MKKLIITASLFILAVMPGMAFGYEVHTHEEMSTRSARASVLGNGTLLSDIDAGSLGSRYSGRTLMEWIRYGAFHEDDFSSLFFPRFVNHFYNPLIGTGLTGSGFRDVLPSPLWGLEDTRIIPRQEFSLKDGLDAYYESLSLPNKSDRDDKLALTFRTLGHAIHLIQDTAQPQHTRNDSHGTGSVYERLTDAMRDIPGFPYEGYPSADSVKFGTARSFWHTLPPSDDRQAVNNGLSDPNAKGMAEYSNRNFVTVGTNYRFENSIVQPDQNFPLPAVYPDSITNIDVAVVQALPQFANCTITRFDTPPLRGTLTFYGNQVTDSYQPSTVTNAYGSTLSIFDPDLESLPGRSDRFFTLNRFNYCAAQQFLIPRAVGYSAGLIDYFFRGKLEVSFKQSGGQLEITVKNISGTGNTLKSGNFELYYDANDGTRKPLTITSGSKVHDTGIVDGESRVLVATNPTDLDAEKSKPFVLLFKGVIGKEQGIAAKVGNGNSFELFTRIRNAWVNIPPHQHPTRAEADAIWPCSATMPPENININVSIQEQVQVTDTKTVFRKKPNGTEEIIFIGTRTIRLNEMLYHSGIANVTSSSFAGDDIEITYDNWLAGVAGTLDGGPFVLNLIGPWSNILVDINQISCINLSGIDLSDLDSTAGNLGIYSGSKFLYAGVSRNSVIGSCACIDGPIIVDDPFKLISTFNPDDFTQ